MLTKNCQRRRKAITIGALALFFVNPISSFFCPTFTNTCSARLQNKKGTICHSTPVRKKEKRNGASLPIQDTPKKSIPSPSDSEKPKLYQNSHFLQDEMLNHRLLSREEENKLGELMNQARKLRILIRLTIEDKYKNDEELCESILSVDHSSRKRKTTANKYLKSVSNRRLPKRSDLLSSELSDVDFEYDIIEASGQSRSTTSSKKEVAAIDKYELSELMDRVSPLHDIGVEKDIALLSESDIIEKLGIDGGKSQLIQILRGGIQARRLLIASNLKLVNSISRNWMKRAINNSAIERTSSQSRLANIYAAGSWDLPSLDDVIHEGVLGLSRAADKYEPKRGLKFSTYATHWITSHVRECFQSASTGSLYVPAQLHRIKAEYSRIMKDARDSSQEISDEEAAKIIGVNNKRLQTALSVTRSLISIDSGLGASPKNGSGKGSAAGGDGEGTSLVMADTLHCSEMKPEEFVELSLLRQNLENAMDAELSPHERDIVRLRLGLDDGKTRSVREVMQLCGGTLSMGEIRSIERRAMKKLRAPSTLHSHNLMAFLEFADVDLTVDEQSLQLPYEPIQHLINTNTPIRRRGRRISTR